MLFLQIPFPRTFHVLLLVSYLFTCLVSYLLFYLQFCLSGEDTGQENKLNEKNIVSGIHQWQHRDERKLQPFWSKSILVATFLHWIWMHQRWLVYQVVAVSAPTDIFVFHFGCTPDRVPLQMASLLGAIATLDALKKSSHRSLS